MSRTDPATQMAREIADLRRRLASVERASQMSRRSLEVDGVSVPMPQVARNVTAARSEAVRAVVDAEAARAAAAAATETAQGVAATADAAHEAALEAVGIAADKGRIVYTQSEPEGDPNTLWIPPPDNVPHRWNGSDWVPVRDTAVADAVSAAAQAVADAEAAYAKAEAAEAAGSAASGAALTAQQAADDAAAEASAALAAAQAAGDDVTAAQAAADAAAQAAEAAQTAADAAGTAAAQADADAAAAAAEAAQALADAAAAAEAAGNAQGTADAAAQAAAEAEQAAQDAAQAAQVAQNTASAASGTAQTALSTAQGKNTVTYSQNAPTAQTPGIRNGDIWWRIDSSNRVIGSWRWDSSATKWTSAVFADEVLNSLTAAKITTGVLQAGARIIAGHEQGDHIELTSSGLLAFRGDLNGDGIPDESIRLGTGGSDRFTITRTDGSLAAGFDEDGHLTAAGASFQTPPRIGAADHTGRGGTLYEILDRRPRGIVGWGARYTNAPDAVNAAGVGIFEIGVRLYAGRMYRIQTSPLRVDSSHDGNLAEIRVHMTEGGPEGSAPPSTPSINSHVIGRVQTIVNTANTGLARIEGVVFSKLFGLNGTSGWRDYRFLLAYGMFGSGNVAIQGGSGDAIELFIEDIGPYTGNLQQENWGGGTSVNPAPPPPAAPPPQRQSRTWKATWAVNFNQAGQAITYGNGASVYQGTAPSGGHGNMSSYIGFDGAALDGSGLTIQQALSGATVEEVGLRLYYPHWYNFAGGEAIIGMHGNLTPVLSHNGGDFWRINVPGWRRNEERWISLGAADRQNWATGWYKGIILGAPTAGGFGRYGYAHGPHEALPPLLNITYWK